MFISIEATGLNPAVDSLTQLAFKVNTLAKNTQQISTIRTVSSLTDLQQSDIEQWINEALKLE